MMKSHTQDENKGKVKFSVATDDVINSLFREELSDEPCLEKCQHLPFNIKITADHIYIVLLIPGVEKTNIQLIINPTSVVVGASVSDWSFSYDKDESLYDTTIYNGINLISPFWKYIIDKRVDINRAEAVLDLGMLFLDLPIMEEDQARLVPVE